MPFSHTLDLATDAQAPVCQQDLQVSGADAVPATDLQRQVARCLARIHVANRRRAAELAWLPRANQAYFVDVIPADFRERLARARQQPAFLPPCGDVARQGEMLQPAVLTRIEKRRK